MENMKCSTCGKEIPADALRCSFCGQIQGFGKHNITENTIRKETTGGTDSEVPHDEIDGTENSQPPEVIRGDITGRLRSILNGQDSDIDLESLRREGLLPENEITESTSESVPESPLTDIPEPDGFTSRFPTTTLPDWLLNSEFNAEGENPSPEEEEEVSKSELAASRGEIPGWVREIQDKIEKSEEKPAVEPNTTAAEPPEVRDESVAEAIERRPTKPAIEMQEPEANLIESITNYISGLKTPQNQPKDGKRRLTRYAWGIIGLAMISLAASLLWSGSSVSSSSIPVSANLVGLTSRIDALSPESVVLIGMDYDLPLAGEINNAAMPVLVHLMSKQVCLAYIPTRPIGAAMANHLIGMGKNWWPDYPDQKAFVFSYLPGEAAGLLQMATNPRYALPSTADGFNPWSTQELSGIQEISDFSLVLLLTDSPGSGRDWIEQVQPHLEDTPLYIIASKQAEPVLKPYLETGQIQAMVAGIAGGASYERVYLFTNNNQQMMKAYQGVLLLIAVLLASVIVLSVFPQDPQVRKGKGSRDHAAR